MAQIILKCYSDGACEPVNPYGNMGMGVCIFQDGAEVYCDSGYVAASRLNSNNVAEYLALEMLLDKLLEFEPKKYWIHLHSDSKLVVRQMNGNWKIKEGLYVEAALRCKSKIRKLRRRNETRIDWIGRNYNERADELSKEIIWHNLKYRRHEKF